MTLRQTNTTTSQTGMLIHNATPPGQHQFYTTTHLMSILGQIHITHIATAVTSHLQPILIIRPQYEIHTTPSTLQKYNAADPTPPITQQLVQPYAFPNLTVTGHALHHNISPNMKSTPPPPLYKKYNAADPTPPITQQLVKSYAFPNLTVTRHALHHNIFQSMPSTESNPQPAIHWCAQPPPFDIHQLQLSTQPPA